MRSASLRPEAAAPDDHRDALQALGLEQARHCERHEELRGEGRHRGEGHPREQYMLVEGTEGAGRPSSVTSRATMRIQPASVSRAMAPGWWPAARAPGR
jgi:hypothetical protein